MDIANDFPGSEHAWLRRALAAPIVLDPPPLTVSGIRSLRRLVALQSEHGILTVRTAHVLQRALDRIEDEIHEYERGV